MNRKAIVTFLFGETYRRMWQQYCEANWRAYAARYGYDIILLDGPVKPDENLAKRPINWQKLLLSSHPEVRAHEDVVFLDADIMINYHRAPCIVETHASRKIGAVPFDRYIDDDFNYYLVFIRQAKFRNYPARVQRRMKTPGRFSLGGPDFSREYTRYTMRRDLPLINTGVLVFKPALHAAYLEQIYSDSYRQVENGAEPGNYEQEYLSYRLLKDDMVSLLDERFNYMAYYEQAIHYPFLFMMNDPALWRICLSTIQANCYFLHFAGNSNLMQFVTINSEEDFAIMGMENVFKGDIEIVRNRSGASSTMRAARVNHSVGISVGDHPATADKPERGTGSGSMKGG